MSTEIKVPDIGDFKNVEIIEVLVKEGQTISKNDPLITLESDKSSVEVPSPFEGKISKLKVKIGDKVSKGSLIGLIDSEANEQLSSKKLDDKVTEKIICQAEENKISPNGNITKPKTKKPSMYKVLLLNDDFTPMEFVVHILERFFNIDHQQAVSIMLTIHQKGLAVVGVYPHEIAETKVAQVMEFSRKNQHPLQCTMEKE